MKKTALMVTALLVLLASIMSETQKLETAKANWIPLSPKVPPPLPPTIVVDSPQNRTYNEKDLNFSCHIEVSLRSDAEFRIWNETTFTWRNYTLQAPQDRAWISYVSYTLDGVETILKNTTLAAEGSAVYDFATTLTDLAEGKHTLTVNASGRQSAADLATVGVSPDKDPVFLWKATENSEDAWSSVEVTFTVDTKPPKIYIQTPQNTTYFTNNVQLAFTVDEPVIWTGYQLDDGVTVDCNGNTQITGLACGAHKLVVYANSTASTGVAETVYFSVQTRPEEPIFSMPQEYINYTITTRSGTMWATVDGNYPLYCANAASVNEVTMLYPTPPGTTNISITLDGAQLTWKNYTEQHPTARHHTLLGDWPIIATTFTPAEFFVLTIHYEHPILAVNESYQFLYDLNIAPYLSASSPISTAHFTLKSEINLSELKVFTVASDGSRRKVDFIIENTWGSQSITFTVTSVYSEPLPGDVLLTFSVSRTQAEPSSAPTDLTTVAAIALIGICGLGVAAWHKKHKAGDKE